MPVNATVAQDPYAGPTVIQGAPGGEPARPAWNQPPGNDPTRPDWNQPPPAQPVQMPPSEPPPPAYTPPAYTPPAYEPPTPSYGQPQQPAYNAQGYSATPQPWTGQTPAQPPKRNLSGCLIGCLVVVLLVVALGAGGFIFLRNQPNGVVLGGVTIGGNATAPGGGKIIYQDALNGSTKTDWADDSNCFFGDGGYHIKAAFICYAPSDKVGDGVTTVTVKQISGPITYGYGLVIRRPSKGNYYEFLIDANGKWLFDKVVNGQTTDIVKFTANSAIKTGLNQGNTIAVQAKGSHFVFSVNGTQVGTADDTTFTSGDTGLSGNDGIEVVYTSLIISEVKS